MSIEKRELFCNQLMPFGNHELWGALTLLLIARGVTLTVLAPKYLFRSSGS